MDETPTSTADGVAFAELAARHRRELEAHCRRILHSPEDAEDAVQETLLRAWRLRGGYRGRGPLRSWLHRIATNESLDALERRRRRREVAVDADLASVACEDDRLGVPAVAATVNGRPDDAAEARETVELAFAAAVEHLPGPQRATLMLRAVLGWSARDVAGVLDTSVAAVNSSLQRARRTLRELLPDERLDWAVGQRPGDGGRELVRAYLDAIERDDVDAFVELLREGR